MECFFDNDWERESPRQGPWLCALALPAGDPAGNASSAAHCASRLLLRAGTHPVSTFVSAEGFVVQGTVTTSQMFFVKKRSFPFGRITCQKISVRTVPKVSSLDWFSLNFLLRWEQNKHTLRQFGSVGFRNVRRLTKINCIKNYDISKKSLINEKEVGI